jgi:hypothetical protein
MSVVTQSVAQAPVPSEQLAGAAVEQSSGLRPLGMPSKEVPPAFAALPYHSSIKAEGGVGPYRVVITGDLPPGVAYEPGYSVVTFSGVPTAMGSFDSQITIIDSNGAQVTHPYNITVRPQPQIANPQAPPAELFIADPEHITTTETDNIFFPAVINIAEHVTTADSDADFSPISLSDPEHITTNDTTAVFFAEILPDPEHITTTDTTAIVTEVGVLPATAPGGTVNVAYNQTFTAVGSTGMVTLTTSGTLPTGLTFGNTGNSVILHGTPTVGGSFPFTITVKDSAHTNIISYTLIITTAAQTITVGALPSPTYGGAAFTLTATSTSGLPVTITSTSALATGTNPFASAGAGIATFQATQAGNSSYSTATPVNFSVSIAPATLTVTAGSTSRLFDQPNPGDGYNIGGLVNGDSSSVITGAPVITTTATPISSITGSPYAEIPTIGTLSAGTNYTFAFINGTLTITPTTQTITFYPIANLTHGTTFPLSARSSSGLPITYIVTGGSIANNILTVGGAGTVTVTATQAGNANYSAATSVSRSFTAQ